MKNFIELTGSKDGQPIFFSLIFIYSVWPRSSVTNDRGSINENCNSLIQTVDNTVFEARETYEEVKNLIKAAQLTQN